MAGRSGLRSRVLQNLIAPCWRKRKKMRTFPRPGEGPRPFARSWKCSHLVKILENWWRFLVQAGGYRQFGAYLLEQPCQTAACYSFDIHLRDFMIFEHKSYFHLGKIDGESGSGKRRHTMHG